MPSQLTSSHPVRITASLSNPQVVSNQGATIYYAGTSAVNSNDSSVADTASVTISQETWFVSASESLITVTPAAATEPIVVPPGSITADRMASGVLTTVTANTQTDNYPLVLSDAGKCVEMNSSSNKTITIPLNATVAFPTGTVIEVCRLNTGTVTIAITATGTLNSPGSKVTLASRYSSGAIRKTATDTWVLSGDLA